MIQRNRYLEQLIRAKDNGLAKVVTGIRRCGKSYLLSEIYKKYLLKTGIKESHILYLGLDEDINAFLRNPLELGKYVRNFASQTEENYYIFLDEIQMVYTIVNPVLTGGKIVLAKKDDLETVSFVDVVLGLSRERNIDLYVTGSNSKMLSKDILTQFRDKATNINIGPLSFEEYFGYVGGYSFEVLQEYMQYGGMPLAVLKDKEEKRQYLIDLFETTYFRDIIEHNCLKKSESLDELCNIISHGSGQLLNAERISRTYLSKKHESLDPETINKYIGYFQDAFIIREAKRYDIRGRKEIGAARKYYFSDTGLRNSRLNFAFEDDGQMLENVIYNELIYNGYTVNIGTFDTVEDNEFGISVRKSNEIDFYAQKGNRKYYIQVSDNIQKEETKARELRPFMMARDNISKVLVLNKPIDEGVDEHGFIIIGAVDFLLRFIK
ncbi:MAG: ATP-binding protein [Bacillota bacterium]|nr:ATP-binding protein [Bacillota bacterium]